MGKPRPLPHDKEAERVVLATAYVYPDSLGEIFSHLGEDDFYVPFHRHIYVALAKLSVKGDPITAHTLDLQMEIDGLAPRGAFMNEIAELSSSWHHPWAVKPFIHRVRAIGNARRLAMKIGEIQESMRDLYQDPVAWVENARQSIEEVAEVRRESRARSMKDLIDAEIASWKAKKEGFAMGISYGLDCLDRRLLGTIPPDYTIIAARPSVGKSALAVQIGYNFGSSEWRGNPVHARIDVFEGTAARLTERALAQQSRVDYRRIRMGEFTAGDNDGLGVGIQRLRDVRMDVEDTNCDEQELVAKWWQWRHDIGIGNPAVIIADYLQIVDPSDPKAPREQQVSRISRAARNATKRLQCSVIFLCQFNRDVEKRGARARPQLSDLRESGSIEQDAANVIAIHRPWAVAETDEERQARMRAGGRANEGAADRDPRYTECLVLKARDGEVGIDQLSFNGRILTFEEIDRQHHRPEDDFTPDTERNH